MISYADLCAARVNFEAVKESRAQKLKAHILSLADALATDLGLFGKSYCVVPHNEETRTAYVDLSFVAGRFSPRFSVNGLPFDEFSLTVTLEESLLSYPKYQETVRLSVGMTEKGVRYCFLDADAESVISLENPDFYWLITTIKSLILKRNKSQM